MILRPQYKEFASTQEGTDRTYHNHPRFWWAAPYLPLIHTLQRTPGKSLIQFCNIRDLLDLLVKISLQDCRCVSRWLWISDIVEFEYSYFCDGEKSLRKQVSMTKKNLHIFQVHHTDPPRIGMRSFGFQSCNILRQNLCFLQTESSVSRHPYPSFTTNSTSNSSIYNSMRVWKRSQAIDIQITARSDFINPRRRFNDLKQLKVM